MKLKKYIDFISESEKFNSLGEWVESLIEDDYVKNIVGRYTKDINPGIDLSNAINILDKRTQSEIKSQIEEYLQNGIKDKDPNIIVSTNIEELTESEITMAGKGIFSSFLKSLTALGQKMINANWEKCPDNFLLFYYYPNLNSIDVKSIFNRFKSLSRYSDMIDYGKNEVNLYYGVRCDGIFEYGIIYDDKTSPIGEFKLSSSSIKWITTLESQSAHSLKKELVNLTLSDIITLGRIKTDMKDFNPGYHEKKLAPILKDKVISFGYYGVGRWDNGKLDEGEFINIKTNFTNWLLSKRWGSKVLISVKPQSFWLYIHIKLK
jgi:hypothetical protein